MEALSSQDSAKKASGRENIQRKYTGSSIFLSAAGLSWTHLGGSWTRLGGSWRWLGGEWALGSVLEIMLSQDIPKKTQEREYIEEPKTSNSFSIIKLCSYGSYSVSKGIALWVAPQVPPGSPRTFQITFSNSFRISFLNFLSNYLQHPLESFRLLKIPLNFFRFH